MTLVFVAVIVGAGFYVFGPVQTAQHAVDTEAANWASQGIQPDAGNLPPAGMIWFGTTFDTTSFAISGQASSFAQGDQVAMVGHLSRTVPGGQGVDLLFDGAFVGSETPSTSDYDVVGLTLHATWLSSGTHTFEIDDLGGNTLAVGSLTITAA